MNRFYLTTPLLLLFLGYLVSCRQVSESKDRDESTSTAAKRVAITSAQKAGTHSAQSEQKTQGATFKAGDYQYCSGRAFFDQEVSFSDSGSFSTYLHHRPAESGSYQLQGRSLIVKASSGPGETVGVLYESGCLRLRQNDERSVYCSQVTLCPSQGED